ncbi:hypothetical protein CEXT_475951 [Caerostris extrusa]|uniref:Uncharacterized protein n=1 Tax=Caerostris extrusa TaxID=172846 RepID=A0AAV4SYL2_CAEEX|nr:hypothetical protein CEXT_475951 [Caerostris extrusa]
MGQLIPVAMRRRDYFITGGEGGRKSYRITFKAGRTFHLIRHPPLQRTPFDMTNRAETVQKLCDSEVLRTPKSKNTSQQNFQRPESPDRPATVPSDASEILHPKSHRSFLMMPSKNVTWAL